MALTNLQPGGRARAIEGGPGMMSLMLMTSLAATRDDVISANKN